MVQYLPDDRGIFNAGFPLLAGPAALEPPPSLILSAEPIANTERYDDLRGNHHVG